jgi:hypothetical protein
MSDDFSGPAWTGTIPLTSFNPGVPDRRKSLFRTSIKS